MRYNFEIRDKENNVVSINTLDEEAAALWNKEVSKTNYANPCPIIVADKNASQQEQIEAEMKNVDSNSRNWYDILGYIIENQIDYYELNTWPAVVHSLMATRLGEELLTLEEGKPIEVAKFEGTEETGIQLNMRTTYLLYFTVKFYQPYIDLINLWQSKGYKPISTK